MECYRRRQMTTHAREQNNTGPLRVGGPVMIKAFVKLHEQLTAARTDNLRVYRDVCKCRLNVGMLRHRETSVGRVPDTRFIQTLKYFPGLAKTKFQDFPGL